MANFSYKKSTSIKMAIAGMLDIENGTIDIDEQTKKITSLLSDFDGLPVKITVEVKDEELLDAPYDDEDEDLE